MQQSTLSLAGPAGTAVADDVSGRRACDQCRQRKIRCDKNWPCSNCLTVKRACTSTGVGQRPKEARSRVLISSQYERKIDQIDSRLESIECLLKNLSTSDISRATSSPQTASSDAARESTAEFDSGEEDAAFEDDSGLTAHTTFASEFLEQAVKHTSLRSANPKMDAALANLGQLVEMQKQRTERLRFPLQRAVPPGGVTKLPMPPMQLVVELLKKNNASPGTLFTLLCQICGVTDISSLCRTVYFPAADVSDATFAVVNALLYNLFLEQEQSLSDSELRGKYSSQFELCRVNLETTLANLPILMSAKIENVQALLLGGLYASDVSRPTVAWHFAATGAQLCLTGGYHRQHTLRNDSPEVARIKRTLFWHTYTLDKGLSLRLGRSSVIRDCDIDIPRVFECDLLSRAGGESGAAESVPTMWLEMSGLQSLVYEQLYSPAAQACPRDELARRAWALADTCRLLGIRANEARSRSYELIREANMSRDVDTMIRGDEVQHYVTETLIYLVIPAPDPSVTRFCNECLEPARKAINSHQECVRKMELDSFVRIFYVHWSLLLTPFAPFFVIFCYIVVTSSAEDMRILNEFVSSLAVVRNTSETIEKLYRLFQVMYDALTVYVEIKSQQQSDTNTMVPIGDEFEIYLGQLGLMPMESQAMGHAEGVRSTEAGQVPFNPHATQIADWFVNNRNMMGLLEEDLSNFELYPWMQMGSGQQQQQQQQQEQQVAIGQVSVSDAERKPELNHHSRVAM